MRTRLTPSELEGSEVTILCIDEGQPALADRTALLESAGYRVFPASTVNAAMQLFMSYEMDLVLSINHLQGISGAELSIFMKQVKPVRIVLLSNGATIPESLLSHVDACLDRDGSPEELLLCLRRILPIQPSVESTRNMMLMEA